MRNARLLALLLAVVALSGCAAKEVSTLWGIASVEIVDEDTILVRDISNDTLAKGAGMGLRNAKREIVGELKVSLGDTFRVDDGHHVFYDYKFLRIEDGSVFLQCDEVVDARSFGDRLEKTKSTLKLKPYELAKEQGGKGT
jgi:hypothetical protein